MSSYALITGASKGLGEAMAVELAKRHYNLLLVARSGDALRALADRLSVTYNVQASWLALDLSAPEAPAKVEAWCRQEAFPITVLVNNAGYAVWGPFLQKPLADHLNMLQLNMQTVVELTYRLLPIMQQQPKCYLLNVASTAAYQAVPTLSGYAASKSFVLTFTRGLRQELKAKNVSVTCLCPGPVNTNFLDRAGMDAIRATAEKFGTPPEPVAKAAIKALFRGKAEVIPGAVNWLSASATRIVPKALVEKIAGSLYNKFY
ncbi:short-chain dehydrogenase [Chitinophaga parva]|uniref:Short-chain dehydrogenase n=1 Tax=Chitinophaga parva TaxID=2169414 RepID=A0A2T7BEL5_9BACT|nr:SDR family oxidoreductase [Chitinophaga parva]PUZ24727.1 short-chain dehydrogenase [Chitinophaga parva]